ncbi:MAG: phosphoribosylglycinamide formyltransferase [Fretibacterium sp.]|nr:phosphoribosylglycinamide formyltransferase [Fretibacterium sp.]
MLGARISVLVSGGGTNLQALLDAQRNGVLKGGKIVQVIASRGDAFALERARKANVRADVVEFRDCADSAEFERKILRLLEEERAEIVVLAGFMHILSEDFVRRYRGRMVNVHPSLIPSFCGKGFYGLKVHEAVLKAGVKVTGATAHIVDAVPDGGPILKQKAVEVLPGDTPQTLQRRVMEQAEWKILPEAVEELTLKLMGKEPPALPARRFEPILPDFGVRGNRYPGRGIILGCAPDGRAALAYFIMGRSPSSRARIFERSGDSLIIKLLDAAKKLDDPSLILYAPVRALNGQTIVTNGDQTDTVYNMMRAGGTFEEALRTREFEPDPPHCTPRISGLLLPDGRYRLNILKADSEQNCERQFFEYEPSAGYGRLIHTYEDNGNPLPSFSGEPRLVKLPEDIDEFANGLWDALDPDNKVSLYVRLIPPDGKFEDRLFNKYGEGK